MELTCHPQTPTDAVRTIDARAARVSGGMLRLEYALHGDVRALRVPAFRGAHAGSDLWRHTCFEAFVAADGAAAYHELNIAPSGAWAVLGFRGYREPEPLTLTGLDLDNAVRVRPDRLELTVRLALGRLSEEYARAPLRIGLTAVVETETGARSYWSLRHPSGNPDFHHPDTFALRLEPPDDAC